MKTDFEEIGGHTRYGMRNLVWFQVTNQVTNRLINQVRNEIWYVLFDNNFYSHLLTQARELNED
jgi:hypothetical protein